MEAAIETALAAPAAAEMRRRLGPYGEPRSAFQLLSGIGSDGDPSGAVGRVCSCSADSAEPHLAERTLLLLAALHAHLEMPRLAVDDRVKKLLAAEFEFFANPPAVWIPRFAHTDVRFREMARIATLRRFPAGQFHWERSGLPRSWLLRSASPIRLLRHVLTNMRGFAPYWEIHLNARRKNRLVLLESEANRSYYMIARSLERQPSVRGLMTASWLFCRTTAQVTPRMAWLRQVPESAGALIDDIGPAPPTSGFLTGSEERRAKYERGEYRPQIACVLWPRASLIAWADSHPEFGH